VRELLLGLAPRLLLPRSLALLLLGLRALLRRLALRQLDQLALHALRARHREAAPRLLVPSFVGVEDAGRHDLARAGAHGRERALLAQPREDGGAELALRL